ncbi:oxidoreductase [Rhodobacteraceae bacterium]|nr:oxidoreductase [Paracoccaceae bacterium]
MDKVIPITGASSGIGEGIARDIARAALHVFEAPEGMGTAEISARATKATRAVLRMPAGIAAASGRSRVCRRR